jgi:hypothetical protein
MVDDVDRLEHPAATRELYIQLHEHHVWIDCVIIVAQDLF